MQAVVTETDSSGNPTLVQAQIRPTLLKDPPNMCSVPLKEQRAKRKEEKEKAKEQENQSK